MTKQYENLIFYDENLKVCNILADYRGNLDDSEYVENTSLKFIQVNRSVLTILSFKTNSIIHLAKMPNGTNGINLIESDFVFEIKPTPAPTEASIISATLLETEINNIKLDKKTKSLAALSFNSVLENMELKKQIKTLSSAVFDLIIKK